MLWFMVILQLINLPVEFDASRRARQALCAAGLVTPEEENMIDRVLSAAAWTHVAGALTGAWSPLRGLAASRLFGGQKSGDRGSGHAGGTGD